uniref:Uncharacterized protein n=1 Tax=Lotus japonicus TaxID=34305 RepID=I3SS02_LOTJA|nr:unknown [Lotus japonicus]
MDLGKRSGTSYSPTVDNGDGRCRFSGAMFTQSCLATSATSTSFVTGNRISRGSSFDARALAFLTSINLRKTSLALSRRSAAASYSFIRSSFDSLTTVTSSCFSSSVG